MKNKNKMKKTSRNIAIWLSMQSFVVIIAAILAFLFVDFMSNATIFGGDGNFRISVGNAIGMIIPMSALLGGLNNYLNKSLLNHTSVLSEAMEKAANGDFNTVLSVKGESYSGMVYSDIYDNYNKMCAELKQVQVLRNDFTNSYSHEFKTPITSIQGFAELLLERDDVITEEERNLYLRIIADESARLADLANSTIMLSKLDSQEIIADKKPYALDEQLRLCEITLASQWQQKNITIDSELTPVTYNGNAQIMTHLWLNLLSNAIKFTPENGEIKVYLSETENDITVSISDSGIGMSEETASHIFEKYYQQEKSHTRQGLGLGLSIVNRITQMIGGNIEVKSALDEGSTFTVTLPK